MADVVASSTNPTVIFKNTTSPPAGGHEYWREVAPGAVLSFDHQPITPLAWTTKMTLDGSGGTELTLSGSSPTLVLEDITSGEDDFQLAVDSDELKVVNDDGSGTTDLATFTKTSLTSHVALTVENDATIEGDATVEGVLTITNATPTLVFDDSSSSDFEIRVDANELRVRNDRGSNHTLANITLNGVFEAWDSQASGTNGVEFRVSPHTDAIFTATKYDCVVQAGLQDNTRGVLFAQNDENGSRPGVLALQDANGDYWMVYVDTDHKLRITNMANFDPGSSNSNTDIVGTQS